MVLANWFSKLKLILFEKWPILRSISHLVHAGFLKAV